MPSQIDITKPVEGNPTTQSVRDNFSTAAAEISALQGATAGSPFLSLGGGTMTGAMFLHNDPTSPMMPATKGYVDAGGGGGGGGGIPEAPSDTNTYGRNQGTWNPVLPTSGGTMTGPITLAADPAGPLEPATREYVDNAVAPLIPGDAPSDAAFYGRRNGAWQASWSTGDVKITLKAAPDPGWIFFDDGAIGDASSGASSRANADTQALFALLWTNTTNANCAVLPGGRGASAAADYAAHKTIALPKMLGRALAAAGSGAGLTARALAGIIGEEYHALGVNEMPQHNHSITDQQHVHGSTTGYGFADQSAVTHTQGYPVVWGDGSQAGGTCPQNAYPDARYTGITGTNNTGGSQAHNTMQPSVFFNIMVKL